MKSNAFNSVLYWAFKVIPGRIASDIGAGIAVYLYRTSPGFNRRATALFAALRPDWADNPALLDAAVRRLWTHFSRTIGEIPSGHRMIRQGRITIDGADIVDGAMASGKPVILTFVHTGNWEMAGVQLAYRYPGRIFAIYDLPEGLNVAQRERLRAPAEMMPVSPMIWRQVLTRLKRPGAILWISADDLVGEQVSAPFFGRPPRLDRNLGKIVRLAMRTGALVVPFYGERHVGSRFTTHILPVMRFEGDPADDAAVLEGVLALDTVFTPPVIRLIDQWFMALHFRSTASIPALDASRIVIAPPAIGRAAALRPSFRFRGGIRPRLRRLLSRALDQPDDRAT